MLGAGSAPPELPPLAPPEDEPELHPEDQPDEDPELPPEEEPTATQAHETSEYPDLHETTHPGYAETLPFAGADTAQANAYATSVRLQFPARSVAYADRIVQEFTVIAEA